MVSFRRSLLALTGLALFAGLASAQSTGVPLSCTATVSVPPLLRAESITDLIGDIVLNCTGGTPPANGTAVPTANITVSLQTNVTSRILPNGASEALLLLDEPGSGESNPGALAPQNVCSSPTAGASATGCAAFAEPLTNVNGSQIVACAVNTGGASCPVGSVINTFQGLVSGNQVTFLGVPVLAPLTPGTSRIFRVTNIRANANSIGAGAFPGTTPVFASVSISGSSSLPISNPVQTAGFVQSGLSSSLRNVANSSTGGITSLGFLQCTSVPSSGTTPQAGTTLRYSEGFATAFKTRVAPTATTNGFTVPPVPNQNVPGMIYNSESGLLVAAGGGTAGLADFGTRLRAVFTNIPAGVNIFVTTTNYNTANANIATGQTWATGNTPVGSVPLGPSSLNSVAVLVTSETAPDFGGTVPVVNFTNTVNGGNIALAPVTLTNGSGEAVWEVVSSNPSTMENFDFGVFYQYTSNTAATGGGTPAIGTGTVSMSFAPVSTSTSASSTATIPRFAVPSGTGSNIVTISICQTALLFPFVTNENGFETGVSIANTTSDPFGTAAQSGTCTLSFFGDNTVANTVVAPCTTAGACIGPVASGKVFANTLSSILGGAAFQGYMFAVCNFQEAHGFAFISDAHATNLAMGYLALVVGPTTTPRGPGGESLGN